MTDSHVSLNGMTYCQKIFGCQMNENDAERVAGMLDAQGCLPVSTIEEADIVIFLTCCVREAADVRLMGQVASLKNIPSAHDMHRIVAIGGCIGQRDGEKLRETLPHVDVVFGTHNLGHLVDLIEQRVATGKPVVETIEANDGFSSDLPATRVKSWSAWVPIMTGCNNFCTYCIVPYVRGREASRTLEDIQAELAKLAEQGIKEITLLGQNVNSYGRDLYGKPKFAEVLRMAGESGIPRVRFVTSHPKDLLPETIATMASYPNIMPQLHLPLQSGSDRILKEMNRVYDVERYRFIVAELRRQIPDIALSTDIIVGFPGRRKKTSKPLMTSSKRSATARCSPLSTLSARARPPRRWKTTRRARSYRSASTGWSSLSKSLPMSKTRRSSDVLYPFSSRGRASAMRRCSLARAPRTRPSMRLSLPPRASTRWWARL